MKLTEYAETLNLEIKIRFGADQVGPWIANLHNWNGPSVDFKNTKDDAMLRGGTGWGQTPELALKDLCRNLSDYKFICLDSFKETRKLLPLPKLESL